MGKGLISKMFDWIEHPNFSEGTPQEWLAGLAVVLLAAFFWSQVVKQIIDAA